MIVSSSKGLAIASSPPLHHGLRGVDVGVQIDRSRLEGYAVADE
jgi:hypothetical protein